MTMQRRLKGDKPAPAADLGQVKLAEPDPTKVQLTKGGEDA